MAKQVQQGLKDEDKKGVSEENFRIVNGISKTLKRIERDQRKEQPSQSPLLSDSLTVVNEAIAQREKMIDDNIKAVTDKFVYDSAYDNTPWENQQKIIETAFSTAQKTALNIRNKDKTGANKVVLGKGKLISGAAKVISKDESKRSAPVSNYAKQYSEKFIGELQKRQLAEENKTKVLPGVSPKPLTGKALESVDQHKSITA